MTNLNRRLKQVEEKLGLKKERYVLVIRCADPIKRLPEGQRLGVEVSPGIYALAYGGPLTSDEIEELRAEYGHHGAS
jgi:hypothetical protein